MSDWTPFLGVNKIYGYEITVFFLVHSLSAKLGSTENRCIRKSAHCGVLMENIKMLRDKRSLQKFSGCPRKNVKRKKN